jgi:putative Mg2+ transporter-C (MgtC) family protein
MFFLTGVSAAPDPGVLQLAPLEIGFRLLCAMIIGLIVGIEREYTHRPAGMRTHILVALGSCTVMLTGQMIFAQYHPYGATPDPARLAAQVIAGVGFLGAGTILRDGASVKGLTTAASLWGVACLGLAVGGGYYMIALVGTVLVILTLTLFELLQKFLLRFKGGCRNYVVDTQDVVAAMQEINALAKQVSCQILNVQAESLGNGTYRLSFQGDFGHGRAKIRIQQFWDRLLAQPSIILVQYQDEAAGVK